MSLRRRASGPRRGGLLRWLELGLWAVACLAVGAVVAASVETRWTRLQADRMLARATSVANPQGAPLPGPMEPDGDGHRSPVLAEGDVIGRIDIPDLGISASILEGDSSSVLRRAVGHIPRTELPGDGGNVGLAGHRDTFFRALEHVVAGQEVLVETLWGSRRYEVVSTRVVDPQDGYVLDDDALEHIVDDTLEAEGFEELRSGTSGSEEREILTLVTCHPFDYIGPAPRRFVVHARRIAADSPIPSSPSGTPVRERGRWTL